MTPAELRRLLEPLGIRPIKGRSQHFLLDEKVVDDMLTAADVRAGDRIVEIGPGPGILTEKLLDAGASVEAVELDMKLCELLRRRFDGRSFTLHEGDALQVPNVRFFDGGQPRPYKVVANVPYAITSPLLKKFLLEAPKPESVTILVQREVAERVTAAPGDMSSIAALVQTYASPRIVRRVAAGAFFPPPKVESAALYLRLRDERELDEFFGDISRDRYFMMIQEAFAEPRKQLKNTLRGFFSDDAALTAAFVRAKAAPSARPAELSLEQWRLLTEK